MSHVLQEMTDLDPLATVLSVDGVGAFDLVSRTSMLRGLQGVEGGGSVLPFVRQFYSGPSSFLWDDACGNTHDIFQGEGGEQGDPLMPTLYSLGQHRALEAVAHRLHPTERLFAFLDDLYVVCRPDRVVDVHHILAVELWSPCKDSDLAREDTGVEPRRSRADGDRDNAGSSAGQRPRRYGVERGPNTSEGPSQLDRATSATLSSKSLFKPEGDV